MYFKGTIVITDPCYIIKKNPIQHPDERDFGLPASISSKPFKDYSTPEELAYKAALDYYFSESRKYDDWSKCEYGENMEVLGIHNVDEEPKEFLENVLRTLNVNLEDEEYGEDESSIPYEGEYIGEFCADAGLVGVFLLDEILAYNPNWKSWIEEHPWCATIIEDFEGEVKYYIDKVDKEAHIVGTGNINFYTVQTGI